MTSVVFPCPVTSDEIRTTITCQGGIEAKSLSEVRAILMRGLALKERKAVCKQIAASLRTLSDEGWLCHKHGFFTVRTEEERQHWIAQHRLPRKKSNGRDRHIVAARREAAVMRQESLAALAHADENELAVS